MDVFPIKVEFEPNPDTDTNGLAFVLPAITI